MKKQTLGSVAAAKTGLRRNRVLTSGVLAAIVLQAAVLLLSAPAFGQSTLKTEYSGAGVVTGMTVSADNFFTVYHDGDFANPSGCQQQNVYHFDHYTYPDADMSKVYSVLLSSHMAGALVRIGVAAPKCVPGVPSSSSDECTLSNGETGVLQRFCSAWGGPVLTRVQIGDAR